MNDNSHENIVVSTNISHVTTDAKCGQAGKTIYTASFDSPFTDANDEVIIPAINHVWSYDASEGVDGIIFDENIKTATVSYVCTADGTTHHEYRGVEVVSSVTRQPTCSVEGENTYTVTYEDENDVIHSASFTLNDIDIVPSGHTWVGPYYSAWDGLNITATLECSGNSDHNIVETKTATLASVKYEATCTTDRVDTYTATFNDVRFTAQSKDVIANGTALGHDWGEVTYTWAPDNSTCAAQRVCARDNNHIEYELVAATLTPIEIDNVKYNKYTASFANESFDEQTKLIEVTCSHEGTKTLDVIAPTCTEKGYTKHICDDCHAVIEITDYIDELGHSFDYEHPTYNWNDSNTECVATASCTRANCNATDSATSTEVTSVTINSTCTIPGSITYTATFDKEHFAPNVEKEIPLEALGHNMTHHDAIPATCLEDGAVEYWSCSNCGQFFSDEHGNNKIDNIVDPKKGHSYGTTTYEWNSDKTQCTATKVCTRDVSHVITETVDVVVTTIDATCESAGNTNYTATFTKTGFETQIINEPIAALGHEYHVLEGGYVWAMNTSTNKMECTVTTTCANNSNHTIKQTVEATYDDDPAAACETTGKRTYTATFTLEELSDNEKVAVNVVDIAATGHNFDYENATYVWNAEHTVCVATATCLNNPSHIHQVISTDISSETTPAQCEQEGKIVYTAIFDSPFTNAIDEIAIEALKHEYGNSYYGWVGSSVKEIEDCNICGEHKYLDTIVPDYGDNKVTLNPTTNSSLANNLQSKNNDGDYNMTFVNDGNNRSIAFKLILDIEHNSDLDSMADNFVLRFCNDKIYNISGGDTGATRIVMYSDLTATGTGSGSFLNQAPTSTTPNTTTDKFMFSTPTDNRTNYKSIGDSFENDYLAFAKHCTYLFDFSYDVRDDGYGYMHLDVVYFPKDATYSRYMGYTQTFTGRMRSDEVTYSSYNTFRITRPASNNADKRKATIIIGSDPLPYTITEGTLKQALYKESW